MSASNPFVRKQGHRNPGMELNDVDIGQAADEHMPVRVSSRPLAQVGSAGRKGNHTAMRKVLCVEGAGLDGAAVVLSGFPTANVDEQSEPMTNGPRLDSLPTSIVEKKKKRRRPKLSRRRPKARIPDRGEFDELNANGTIEIFLSTAEHERLNVDLRRSPRHTQRKKRRNIVITGPSVSDPVHGQVSIPVTVATTATGIGGGLVGSHSAESLANPPVHGTAAQGNESRPTRSSSRIRSRRQRARKSSAPIIIDLTGDDDSVILEEEDLALQDLTITAPPHNFGDIPISSGESVPHPGLEPLVDEEEKLVAKLFRGRKSSRKMSTIPSARITLRWRDFALLRGNEWLNDEVINAYMALINDREKHFWGAVDEGRMEAEHGRPRSFCFNTFFFTRLVDGSESGYDYGGVARWTKRAQVDIAKLDYVIIPINLGNNHWILVVVNIPVKEMYYLDSMKGKDDGGVVPSLQQWVLDEIRDKSGLGPAKAFEGKDWSVLYQQYQVKRSISGASIPYSKRFHKIPTQRTSGSCGVYAAKMADCIALGIPVYFSSKDIGLMRRRMALELYRRVLPG